MTSQQRIDLSKVNRTQLSKATGIDMAHISRIFNRRSRPSLELALKIAAHLDVTVEVLCASLGIGRGGLEDGAGGILDNESTSVVN